MIGWVDDDRRALCEVIVRQDHQTSPTTVIAWIDTAFNGHFVFSEALIEQLGLPQEAATEAILADGSRVTLASYRCVVEWFGEQLDVQVIANDGRLPLLGTELLDNHRLMIDYSGRAVSIE